MANRHRREELLHLFAQGPRRDWGTDRQSMMIVDVRQETLADLRYGFVEVVLGDAVAGVQLMFPQHAD